MLLRWRVPSYRNTYCGSWFELEVKKSIMIVVRVGSAFGGRREVEFGDRKSWQLAIYKNENEPRRISNRRSQFLAWYSPCNNRNNPREMSWWRVTVNGDFSGDGSEKFSWRSKSNTNVRASMSEWWNCLLDTEDLEIRLMQVENSGSFKHERAMTWVWLTDVCHIRGYQAVADGLEMNDPPFNPGTWKTLCDTYFVTICRSGQCRVYISTTYYPWKTLCRVEVKADHHSLSVWGSSASQAMQTSTCCFIFLIFLI